MTDWMELERGIWTGKKRNKKWRKMNMPTMNHRYGSITHSTINGKGKIARIK